MAVGCESSCKTSANDVASLAGPTGLGRSRPPVDPGSIEGMPELTTIKVSTRTRDALRQLAEREGLTLDAQLDVLIRRERRRMIGRQLSGAPLDADDRAVLDASASDVADACG